MEQNYNNIGQQVEIESNNHKNKKKGKVFLILFILVIIGIGSFIYFIKLNNNKNPETPENNNELVDTDTNVYNKLEKDFESGKITTDDYVKYNLYAMYDKSLLGSEYTNLKGSEVATHIHELVDKYYEQLSDETLNVYLRYANLENLTFELDKENKDSNEVAISDLLVDEVYAKDDVTNLNNAVLSKNGNFVVWYTTTGDSAITYEDAKKTADTLEETISEYSEIFNVPYRYKSTLFSEGKTYENQLKILENSNIDKSYLTSAMQVYIYTNKSLDFAAQYNGRRSSFLNALNKLRGGDGKGAVALPYIIINKEAFSDFERLEQLANHEMFHHWQHEVLCGTGECIAGTDPYINEATANWASGLVTDKTTIYGFLNEWAGTARLASSNLMSTEFEEKNGAISAGYASFVYLYNYVNNVPNGVSKAKQAIYENDALTYLQNNSTVKERFEIQKNIAFQNLKQNYENKNFIVSPSFSTETLRLKQEITQNTFLSSVIMNKNAIDYYLVNKSMGNNLKISILEDPNIAIFLIGHKGNDYVLLDSSYGTSKVFETFNYSFDELYIAVANLSINASNKYTLNISAATSGTISFEECNYNSESLNKLITTYYYDSNENIYKIVETAYWIDSDEASTFYNNSIGVNKAKYSAVKLNNSTTTTYEWSKESFDKYWKSLNLTKTSITNTNKLSCGTNTIVENFVPDLSGATNPEVTPEESDKDNNTPNTDDENNQGDFITSINNYNIEVLMKTNMSGISVSSVSTGIIDEVNQKEYLEISTTTMGLTVTNKAYYDFVSGYSYMTQPYGGDVWYKEKGATQTIDLENILSELMSNKNVTKVSSDHYIVKMDSQKLNGVTNSSSTNTSSVTGTVEVDVYTKNGYITKLEYDFTDIMPELGEFSVTINFSNYNKAGNIEIPQSVISGAKQN